MNENCVFLEGERVVLRPLLAADFDDFYHAWLNDPEVNEYSQRRPFPTLQENVRAYHDYYVAHSKEGFVLGVVAKDCDNTLIGAISLVNIQLIHRCCEIAILIGDKEAWGRGYAQESISLLTRHAFIEMNMHKVFAGTFNPAFVKCVEKLGWQKEGVFRERIWSQGRFHDQIWLAILRDDFLKMQEPKGNPEEGQNN